MERFICGQCKFQRGKCLVFLKRDQNLFCGHGWNNACLPVKDGRVKWSKDLDQRLADTDDELKTVIALIESELQMKK